MYVVRNLSSGVTVTDDFVETPPHQAVGVKVAPLEDQTEALELLGSMDHPKHPLGVRGERCRFGPIEEVSQGRVFQALALFCGLAPLFAEI